jgi:Outer membrane protein beta-barrel domain
MKILVKLAVRSLALVHMTMLSLGAQAQASDVSKFYLGIGVGPIIPQAVTSNLSGAITGSGKLEFNASGFVGLVGGYRLAKHFGIDVEGGWTLYDSHDLVGAFSQSSGPLAGDIPLNGDMHTWLGLGNFVFWPHREGARLAPYFGAGLGAAGLEWLVDSRPGGRTILSLRGGSTRLAADAVAGVDYALRKRFSLGGRYSFVYVPSEIPTISGAGITLAHSAPKIHLLQMVGTYRF